VGLIARPVASRPGIVRNRDNPPVVRVGLGKAGWQHGVALVHWNWGRALHSIGAIPWPGDTRQTDPLTTETFDLSLVRTQSIWKMLFAESVLIIQAFDLPAAVPQAAEICARRTSREARPYPHLVESAPRSASETAVVA